MKIDRFTKSIVVLNGAVPVLLLTWDALTDELGANPVNFAIRTTGILALIFIILTLAVTPVSRIMGWSWLGQFRRVLGLYAFFHASLHFLIFFWFDRQGSIASTFSEITMRTYLWVGIIGLVLMAPLAVTSTNRMIKRLGPALEDAAPSGLCRRDCRRASLRHARESGPHPAHRVRHSDRPAVRLEAWRPLLSTAVGLLSISKPACNRAGRRPDRRLDGETEAGPDNFES